MKPIKINEGKGRTKVTLSTQWIGNDLIVCVFNQYGHIGAVAVSDYHPQQKRASTSVITRFGHKDDSIAYMVAYRICSYLKKPVCAITGIHLDDITQSEIAQIAQNCDRLVDRFVGRQ
jgi:gallate decarboxylase subunit D